MKTTSGLCVAIVSGTTYTCHKVTPALALAAYPRAVPVWIDRAFIECYVEQELLLASTRMH